MPLGQWNVEWLNHNSQREYPLSDDSTRYDSTASFRIPTDFIVGLDLPVHAAMDMAVDKFYIKSIGAYATGFSLIVGYDSTSSGAVDVATAMVVTDAHEKNTTYALGGLGEFSDTIGKIVIGSLDSIIEQPTGSYTFEPDGARISTDAIRPIIRGVSSIIVKNGIETSARLQGDIELVAGSNIQLVPIISSESDPVIRINAISGQGLVEDCGDCEGDLGSTPAIKTINGITPSATGEFHILGDDCISWEDGENSLQMSDSCSAPCCGCEELEEITRDLERFRRQASTLELFLGRLDASVTQMDLVVLGARLGDRGCIQCE
jgi:hypothetical protein